MQEIDFLKKRIDAFHEINQTEIRDLEEHVEFVEKQLANMTVAFGEMSVMLDGLLAVVQTLDDDTRKIFAEAINNSRQLMLEIMEGARDGMEPGSDDVAGAVANMAPSSGTDPSN